MNLKDRLLRRPSIDEESPRDSLALPRFSFESDNRALVSTDRLFRQWGDQATGYDPGYQIVEGATMIEQDIIVCTYHRGPRLPLTPYCRSHGTVRTIHTTLLIGLKSGSGSLLFLYQCSHSSHHSPLRW